jgi:hypothetical protein
VKIRLLATALGWFALTGCYVYTPVTTTPRSGERIRVSLTQQGTVELARYLGPRVTVAEGTLQSVATDGAYVVAVDFVQLADRTRQPWTGEGSVTVPLNYASGAQQRTFRKRQTVVTAAAISGGIIAAAVIALRTGGAGGGGGTPPPPPP